MRPGVIAHVNRFDLFPVLYSYLLSSVFGCSVFDPRAGIHISAWVQ